LTSAVSWGTTVHLEILFKKKLWVTANGSTEVYNPTFDNFFATRL